VAGGERGHPLAGVGLRPGVVLLYGYLHDWLAEYATLAALGIGKDNMPESLFARMVDDLDKSQQLARPAADRVSRAEQIAAFVAAAGE
jgi:hypothetical protein